MANIVGDDNANRLPGTAADDVIQGLGGADTLIGGDGADAFDGGAGIDEVDYSTEEALGGAQAVFVNVNTGSGIDAFGSIDTYTSIEAFRLTRFDDNVLNGEATSRTVRGLEGDDFFEGNFIVAYDLDAAYGGTAGVTVDLSFHTAIDGFGNSDRLVEVAGVIGTAAADSFSLGTYYSFALFQGNGGNDTISGGGASYADDPGGVFVDLGAGTATDGFGGIDVLFQVQEVRGSAFADTLLGGDSPSYRFQRFVGGAGDDSIDGGATGPDTLSYFYDPAGVVVDLVGGRATDGYGDTDTIAGIEVVIGSDFDDEIRGNATTTLLDGGTGADALWGGAGAEVLRGGDGNDTLFASDGQDSIYGDAGRDEVDYSRAEAAGGTRGITVDRTLNSVIDPFGYTESVLDVEAYRGTSFDDQFTGNINEEVSGPILYRGLAGADRFSFSTSADIVAYDLDADYGGTAGVVVDLATGTATDGFGDIDTLTGVRTVIGSSAGDSFVGSDDPALETFDGRGGNDTIDGAGGPDAASYADDPTGVTVDLGTGVAADGFGGTDTLSNIEQVHGSAFADLLRGGDAAAPPHQTFIGNAGDDTIDGGTGVDVVSYADDPAGVSASLVTGSARDGHGSTDVLQNVEWLIGSRFADALEGGGSDATLAGGVGDDTLTGGDGNDSIDGGDGNDTLAGGAGSDTLSGASGFDYYTDTFVAQLFPGTVDTAYFEAGQDIVDLSEILPLLAGYTSGSDPFAARYLRLVQEQAAGVPTDTLLQVDTDAAGGTAGFVTVMRMVDVEADFLSSFTFGGFEPTVAYDGTPGNDTLYGSFRDESFDGKAGDDFLQGLGGNDTLAGSDGDDTLFGSTGDDELDGGAGNDFIRGDDEGIDEDFGAGSDDITGGDGNDTLIAGSGDDSIAGDAGDDLIYGGAGADLAMGGDGSDLISGGDGDDRLAGDAGDDFIYGDAGSDVISSGPGNDWANGGSGSDSLTGGSGNDTLHGGTGFDLIRGESGNDFVSGGEGGDDLDGGAGLDTLMGGGGADTLYGGLDLSFDRLVSTADGDEDLFLVRSPVAGVRAVYDQIEGFEAGIDRIDMSATGARGLVDLGFSEYAGVGVKIVGPDLSAVLVLDQTAADVQAEWFVFA